MKRKAIQLAVAMTLTVSVLLSGCGSPSDQGKEIPEAETENADSGMENKEEADSGETSGKITFPLEEPVTLTAFVYAAATGGGTYQDNYATKWIEEQTNIHLEFVTDVDGDEGVTKQNLMMTDPDSLPDVLIATTWSKAESQLYGEQGLILPLNEYLKDAPNWQALSRQCEGRVADLTCQDGNIYSFGRINECFHCIFQNRMWIYKPWVDQLMDGKMPETTEELYEFLTKVKNEDPNGNGEADEIPMTGYIGGWSTDPCVWVMNSFLPVVNPLSNTNLTVGGGFIADNGKVIFQCDKDAYREGVRFLNKLYEEGLLDTQTFTQDDVQFVASIDDHRVAMYPAGMQQGKLDELWNHEPGDYMNWYALEPVAGPDGVRFAATSLTNYYFPIGYITKNCKDPELAIALFDFLASKEASLVVDYGPEGVTWDYTSEGTSLDGGTPVFKTYNVRDSEGNVNIDWEALGYDHDYEHYTWYSDAAFGSATEEYRAGLQVDVPEMDNEAILHMAAKRYEKYAIPRENLIPVLNFDQDDSKKIADYTLTIGGYVNQALVQFITGDLDIEKDWDAYISKLQGMGLDDYIATYQKAYDEFRKLTQ